MHTPTNTPFTAYLAADGFIQDLRQELIQAGHSILAEQERLLLASGPAYPAAWAQNIWHEPVWLPVASIKHAARSLKTLGRNWTLYATANHRRAALIQQELAPLPKKLLAPHPFGLAAPDIALGAWCLWQPDMVLAASRTASPFPHGEVPFAEDKINPPSRAYLKLWELFTLTGHYPAPGELCVDLGSCPGGWTWVLAELGARVFSIDKAPLASHVARNPLVQACQGSGFALEPEDAGAVDWVFSDMICYPDRLWTLVERWIERGQCRHIVCTLKFQGETDFATMARFGTVPGSSLRHLSCNRHELTWEWHR